MWKIGQTHESTISQSLCKIDLKEIIHLKPKRGQKEHKRWEMILKIPSFFLQNKNPQPRSNAPPKSNLSCFFFPTPWNEEKVNPASFRREIQETLNVSKSESKVSKPYYSIEKDDQETNSSEAYYTHPRSCRQRTICSMSLKYQNQDPNK